MSNYLELAQLPDGTIVLRRSDDQDNPIVKIEFSNESKEFLQGQELSVAKEMIRAGIESVSGNVSDFDEFFDEICSKKPKFFSLAPSALANANSACCGRSRTKTSSS